jgi:POT family proton-dependent oligopeptide transporter
MAIGHFMMAFEALFFFALMFLILGIGAFKPNISTQVGGLYAPGDARRDRAYSIFYVGINIGAFLAPLVCGTLAVAFGWHYGFAAAGVGMLTSLAIYRYGWRTLPLDEMATGGAAASDNTPLDDDEKRAIKALLLICALVTLFWATYDQQSNTLLLWAEDHTERSIDLGFWKGEVPTPWFLALNPLLIFFFTPLIVRLWAVQARRGSEPFTASKIAFGCLGVALANLLMAAGAWNADGAKASALWLVGYFILVTLGELYLSPVGLALISKTAPARKLSMMMGCWFATTFPGDILGGWLGGFWSTMEKPNFFLMIAAIAALAGGAIWVARTRLGLALDR